VCLGPGLVVEGQTVWCGRGEERRKRRVGVGWHGSRCGGGFVKSWALGGGGLSVRDEVWVGVGPRKTTTKKGKSPFLYLEG